MSGIYDDMLNVRKKFLDERKKGKSEKKEKEVGSGGEADVVLKSVDEEAEKIKKGKEREEEEKQKEAQKIPEKDGVLENIMVRMKAAAEVGDEEEIKELEEEIKKHKEDLKTVEELFEKAQALEAGKESREKESREKEKLSELEKQLDEARGAFVKKDIEAEKIKLSFKSVLWKTLRIGSLGEYEKEHEAARDKYYETLKNYKNEYLNIRGLNEKSVAEMVTFFNIKEHYSLESVRIDTSNENAGWPKKAWNGYMGMIDRYRKIGENDKSKFKKYSKKIVAGMFVSTVAVGAAVGGGAAFGAIAGSAAAGWGALTGAGLVKSFTIGVSSTGFKAIYEGLAQGSRAKKSQNEVEEIIRQSKVEGTEELQLDLVNKNLDNKIASINEALQEQKQWKRFRTFAAIGTAVAISQFGRYFGRWASEKVNHWFGGTGTPTSEIPATKPGGGSVTPEVIVEKTIDLPVIEEGGNIEGSVIKYLTDNPDLIDKYNEQLGGGRKFDAGQIAHRMLEEYGDKRDLVHVGAQVRLSPDGLHIQGMVGDKDMGFLHENISGATAAQPKINVVPDNIENPEINAVPENIPPEAIVSPENLTQVPENLPNPADSHFGRNVSYVLDDLDKHIDENTSELSRPETHDAEELAAFREKIANLGYSRGFLESFRDSVFHGNMGEAAKSFRSAIALGEKWDNIKGMNFREATKNMNWRASDKLGTIFKCLKETLGNDVRPGSGETLEKWTERVSKLAIEKAK